MRPAPAPPDDRRGARRLALAFFVLVALTLGLMVLGALVRAHGAGLACPDWPLCFGEFVPRMDLKVAFEWTHRVVAGALSLLFAGLAVATLRRPALAPGTRALLGAAAVLLATQILLGALTVWRLLAVWTVTAHLVTANLFAITLLLIGLRLRELAAPGRSRRPVVGASRDLLAAAAALLALQIVLGGLVSSAYAGMACPEWPTCIGGIWFPAIGGNVALHLVHRTNGYALALVLAAAALAARGQPVAGLSLLALCLCLAQVAVGVANVLLGLPPEVTGLHTALAEALVLTLVLALHRAWARSPS